MPDQDFAFEEEDEIDVPSQEFGGEEFEFQDGERFGESEEEDTEEELLPGLEKEEIIQALKAEFGREVDEDRARHNLALELVDLREEELQESSENGAVAHEEVAHEEDDDPDVDVDWADDQDTILAEDEETGEEPDFGKSLEQALKVEGIDPKDMTVEKAKKILDDSEIEAQNHQTQILMMRWRQGLLAKAIPNEYGDSSLEDLADATGVHVRTLRTCRQVVEHWGMKREAFQDWIKAGNKETRYWTEVRDEIREETTPPEDPDTEEEEEEVQQMLDEMKQKAERLANSLQKMNQIVEQIEDPDDDVRREIQGITKTAMAEIKRFQKSRFYKSGELSDSGEPIPRSDEYKDFIKRYPDPISGKPPHDGHHTETGGQGIKGSDLSQIPLDRKHHDEFHQKGQEWFETQYNVDIDRLVKNYIHRFTTGQWLDMQLPEPSDL